MSAPSEMRCRLMPVNFMATKVMARTSGIAIATTMPGRQPSDRKLTPSTMAMASISVLMNSPTASSTTCGWLATRCDSIPAGKSEVSWASRSLMCSPNCQNVGVLAHRDGEADGRSAVVAEHRLLRVDVGSSHLGDVAQPEEPAIDAEVDGLQALFRRELPRNANGDLLVASIDGAARLDRVLRLQRFDQLGNVEPHGGELLGRELEIDLLVLRADEIDLRNVGNAEQFGSHALGIIAQLAMGEAVRSQRKDQRHRYRRTRR